PTSPAPRRQAAEPTSPADRHLPKTGRPNGRPEKPQRLEKSDGASISTPGPTGASESTKPAPAGGWSGFFSWS
ncbi:hypothetical protein, partial [Mycolicibacterium sp. XJ879]